MALYCVQPLGRVEEQLEHVTPRNQISSPVGFTLAGLDRRNHGPTSFEHGLH